MQRDVDTKSTDILIIGAGPVGVYFGWKMAQKGLQVSIIEQSTQENLASRLDSFHLDSDKFAEFGVPIPQTGDPDYITVFKSGIRQSPFDHFPKTVHFSFHVLRLHPFMMRLVALAENAGVSFHFSTKFQKLRYIDTYISGIEAFDSTSEKIITFQSKLVVDAAGMHTPVRSSLPKTSYIDNFAISPSDQFYVTLRYVNWNDPSLGDWDSNIGWTYYKTWVAPAPKGAQAIIGIGQPGSYQAGEQVLQDFLATIKIPEFEVVRIERGSTPYRRPPYSVVDDGILILGDAACLTKPFSGEGIVSSWTLAKIACDHLIPKLFAAKSLSKETLWPINKAYFRDQGAKFAELLAQIPAAANTTKKEMEYLFRHDVIFSEEDFRSMEYNYQMTLSFPKLMKIIGVLLWGVVTGRYSLKNLKSLVSSLQNSGKIRKHYEAYPDDPATFPEWKKQAKSLWEKIPKMD